MSRFSLWCVRMSIGFPGMTRIKPQSRLILLVVTLLALAPVKHVAGSAKASAASQSERISSYAASVQVRAAKASPTPTATPRGRVGRSSPTPTASPTAATGATLSLSLDLSAVSAADALGELAMPVGGGQAKPELATCQDFRDFSFPEPTALGDGYAVRSAGKGWNLDASSRYLNEENVRDQLPVWHEGPGFILCGLTPGEPVQISVFDPDGNEIFTRVGLPEPIRDDPPNTCSYPTTGLPQDFCYSVVEPRGVDILPWEPTGAYRVEAAQGDSRFTKTFEVVAPMQPDIYYSDRASGYVLSGFEPNERVKIVRYEGLTPVGTASLQLDERGAGLLLGPQFGATTSLAAVREDFSVVSYGGTGGIPTIDFDALIEQDPTNARAYYARGLVRLDIDLGEPKPVLAIQDFTQAIALDPGFLAAYIERARTLKSSIGDVASAIRDLSRAIQIDPSYAPAYQQRANLYVEQKQWKLAIADLTALLDLQPTNVAGTYAARAAVYEAAGENALAIEDYREVVAAAPESASAYFALGRLYDATGDNPIAAAAFERATRLTVAQNAVVESGKIEDYSRLVELEPNSAFAWYALGLKRADEESVADLDKAIALAPDFVDAYRARARKLSYLDLKQAISAYALLLQFEPANRAAYREKAILEEATGDLAAAIEDYERSHTCSPQARQLAARVAESSGNVALAIDEYSTLIETMPNFLPALYFRGSLYEQVGDAANASADYSRITETAPEDAQIALYSRARLHHNFGEYATARADLEKALTLDDQALYGTIDDYNLGVELLPDSPLPYFRRGQLAFNARQEDETVLANINAALAVDPNYVPALKLRARILSPSVDAEASIGAFTDLINTLEASAEASSASALYDAYSTRASLYENAGEREKAISDYTSAIDTGSGNELISEWQRNTSYESRASLYEASGEHARAIADYDWLISVGSTWPWNYRYDLAKIYDAMGDTERARSAYMEIIEGHPAFFDLTYACERLVELAPQYGPAYFCRGKSWHEQGEYQKAITDLTAAIKLGLKEDLPGKQSAFRLRGDAYYALRDYDRAIDDYTAEFNHIQELERSLDVDLTGDASTDVQDLLTARGKAYYNAGRYQDAIADLSAAIAMQPSRAGAQYTLAKSYNAVGDTANARAVLIQTSESFGSAPEEFTPDDYEWFVDLAPDYGPTYLYRGIYLYKQEEYGRAVNDFTQAIKLGLRKDLPSDGSAYRLRGDAYYNLQEYDRAVEDYTAELHRLVELKQSVEEQSSSSPTVIANILNTRGNAHYMARRYQDAIADYTEAISNQSDHEFLYANRGNAYFGLGDYALAASDYSQAIDLMPSGNDYQYYRLRGNAYRQLGDNEKALADYETFVANTGDGLAKATVQQIIAELK